MSSTSSPRSSKRPVRVTFGVDRAATEAKSLKQARVGLVTNDVAGTADGSPSRVHLRDVGVNVTRLFGPEHGIAASAADGEKVTDSVDPLTGLPVVSLYGATQRPTAEMFGDVDAIAFDIPDIGSRFYTYIWTLSHVLEVAAETGKPVYVLDRPNPICGDLACAEGPVLDEAFVSTFVGRWRMPIRHSLTVGELARLWNAERGLKVDLHVIPCAGWNRGMHWPQTNLPFVPTSPNMPDYEAALLYAGTCLFEGTNLCEGRGTDAPFKIIGAPYVVAADLAEAFNAQALPGVRAEALTFTPTARKFENKTCHGVRLHVTDAECVRPVSVGLHLVGLVARLYPGEFRWDPYPTAAHPDGGGHFARLVGVDHIMPKIESRPVDLTRLVNEWTACGDWAERAAPHLLYP
jgi:uncharacterized protein YbbC (DUF1343 family)